MRSPFEMLDAPGIFIPMGLGALVATSLVTYFLFRVIGLWTAATLLKTFNSGVLRKGKPISGPAWQWPNGQFTERFMNARAKSEEWAKYGPIYRLWAGHHPEIVITTPELVRAFHTDSVNHGKTLDGNFGWYFGQLLGRCVGLLVGEEWTSMRKVLEPAFRHSAAVNRIGFTESEAESFVKTLPSLSDTPNADTFSLHAVTAFMKCPFFLSAEVVYGKMTEKEKEDLWALAERRMALTPNIFRGGLYRSAILRWYDAPLYCELMQFVDDWKNFNVAIAKDRVQEGNSLPIVDYWTEYIEGRSTIPKLTHSLDEMLFANLDVTTYVLTWLITLVADHPEAIQELREEIAANADNLPKYITRNDTHLQRCFYESIRVRPLTIFTVGESSPIVKNLNGILVKPNTMVVIDTLAINVRNPFWGPNSEDFEPSRFKNIKQSELRYNLALFGFGYRKCLGQYFAGHMVKSIAVHLFQQYNVQVSDGRKGDNDYEIDKTAWVPMADVILQLTKRASSV